MLNLLKMLVYSPVGHGKTTLLGTAQGDPRLVPALILDFEGGVDAIRSKVTPLENLSILSEAKLKDEVYVWRVKEWRDFQVVHDRLLEFCPFRLVAIDSLSEVNYLANQTVLRLSSQSSRQHDPDILEQMDYQRVSVWVRRLVRAYRDLDCHVVMTALAQDAQDPISREFSYRPALTGKLSVEVPAMFSIVGYLALVGEESERHLFTKPSERFLAKDRSEGGKLRGDLPNPTLPKILDLLEV